MIGAVKNKISEKSAALFLDSFFLFDGGEIR